MLHMLKFTEIPSMRKALTSVTCNLCGEEVLETCGIPHQFEFATLTADWGYGSRHDMQSFEVHFCERCVYEKILSMLKVQPEISESL